MMDQVELCDRISRLLLGTAAEVLALRQRLLGQDGLEERPRRKRAARTGPQAPEPKRRGRPPGKPSPLKGIPRDQWKYLKAEKAKPAPVRKLARGESGREDRFATARKRGAKRLRKGAVDSDPLDLVTLE